MVLSINPCAGPLGARKCAPSTEGETRQQELEALRDRRRILRIERTKVLMEEPPAVDVVERVKAYRAFRERINAALNTIDSELEEIKKLIMVAGGEFPDW